MVSKASNYIVVFYILVSLFGYVSTFDSTPEVFVERIAPWGTDVFMTIAQVFIIFSLITNTMVNYVAWRGSVFGLIFENPEVAKLRYCCKRSLVP